MKAAEALIAWTPPSWDHKGSSGEVKVGPLLHEGDSDWTLPYSHTGGAANVARRTMTGDRAVMMVFIDYHTLVYGDGLDPKVVHDAFLAIDEFAEHIAPDLPGARFQD